MKKIGLILFALCFVFGVAQSKGLADTILFQDNFNSEHGGVGILNYTGFANWNVTDGTVDLIGNGFYDFYPGNGLYVDLDGSTSNAGVLTTNETFNLLAGVTYKLAFDLGGNQRNTSADVVSVTIIIGTATYTVSSSALLQTELFTLTPPINMSGKIAFSNAGGDNIGAIVDNVILSQVPEPSVLLLLGSGLLGLLGLKRKSKK